MQGRSEQLLPAAQSEAPHDTRAPRQPNLPAPGAEESRATCAAQRSLGSAPSRNSKAARLSQPPPSRVTPPRCAHMEATPTMPPQLPLPAPRLAGQRRFSQQHCRSCEALVAQQQMQPEVRPQGQQSRRQCRPRSRCRFRSRAPPQTIPHCPPAAAAAPAGGKRGKVQRTRNRRAHVRRH